MSWLPEPEINGGVWALVVSGAFGLAAVLVREIAAWRKRQTGARDALRERRRIAWVEKARRESDQLRIALDEWERQRTWWEKQMKWLLDRTEMAERERDEAEAHHIECERRCTELQDAIKGLEFDIDFLNAHRIESGNEIERLRAALAAHTLTTPETP